MVPEATFEVSFAESGLRYYGALVLAEYGRAAEWAPGRQARGRLPDEAARPCRASGRSWVSRALPFPRRVGRGYCFALPCGEESNKGAEQKAVMFSSAPPVVYYVFD